MKNYNMSCKIIFIIFLLGLFYIITNKPRNLLESFTSDQCPNLLIQKDNFIYLYNAKLAKVPGINPIRFNNLEDYVEYTHWQRSQNINCPILFLQHSYDTQGNPTYKKGNLPTDSVEGLPHVVPQDTRPEMISKLVDSNRNDPPYNQNHYPGFDKDNQYIGLTTPLDKMQHQNLNGVSPNPMDTIWGGHEFTQSLVKKGYYKDNEVLR